MPAADRNTKTPLSGLFSSLQQKPKPGPGRTVHRCCCHYWLTEMFPKRKYLGTPPPLSPSDSSPIPSCPVYPIIGICHSQHPLKKAAVSLDNSFTNTKQKTQTRKASSPGASWMFAHFSKNQRKRGSPGTDLWTLGAQTGWYLSPVDTAHSHGTPPASNIPIRSRLSKWNYLSLSFSPSLQTPTLPTPQVRFSRRGLQRRCQIPAFSILAGHRSRA